MRFDKKTVITTLSINLYLTCIFLTLYYQSFLSTYEQKYHFIETYQHSNCHIEFFIPCETQCYYSMTQCMHDFYIVGPSAKCCPAIDELTILSPIQKGLFELLQYVLIIMNINFIMSLILVIWYYYY